MASAIVNVALTMTPIALGTRCRGHDPVPPAGPPQPAPGAGGVVDPGQSSGEHLQDQAAGWCRNTLLQTMVRLALYLGPTTEDTVTDSTGESFESLLAGLAVGEYLANPEDPHSFYQMGPGGPQLHQCPDADDKGNKLVFDPSLNVCVWPRDYSPPNA
jgi:hypothetical protein